MERDRRAVGGPLAARPLSRADRRLAMGDYLGSVALRTLAAPTIRPRARAIFEPQRTSGVTRLAEIEQHVEITEGSAAPSSLAPRAVAHEPATPTRAPARQAAIIPGPAATPVTRTTRLPREEPAPASRPHTPAPFDTRTDTPAQATLSAKQAKGSVDSTSDANPVRQTPARSARGVERIERQTIVASRETIRTAQPRTPDQPAHPLRALLPTPTSIPAQAPARNEQQTLQPAHADASGSGGRPDIHIAIGRVIVNAPTAPAPRAEPAPSAAVVRMPLEQYLRQRGGRA